MTSSPSAPARPDFVGKLPRFQVAAHVPTQPAFTFSDKPDNAPRFALFLQLLPFSGPVIVLATRPLSAGVSQPSPRDFRQIAVLPSISGPVTDISGAYLSQFQPPAEGMKVAVQLVPVTPNGFKGSPFTQLVSITQAPPIAPQPVSLRETDNTPAGNKPPAAKANTGGIKPPATDKKSPHGQENCSANTISHPRPPGLPPAPSGSASAGVWPLPCRGFHTPGTTPASNFTPPAPAPASPAGQHWQTHKAKEKAAPSPSYSSPLLHWQTRRAQEKAKRGCSYSSPLPRGRPGGGSFLPLLCNNFRYTLCSQTAPVTPSPPRETQRQEKKRPLETTLAPTVPTTTLKVVALAASAGGLDALSHILHALPADFPAALVVVQHLEPDKPSQLAHILGTRTALRVKQADEGDTLQTHSVYLAPPGMHLLVNSGDTLSLSLAAKEHFSRPAADVLFRSVAETCGPRALAIVLTGGDGDGASGIGAIKAAGGTTLAQDEATSRNPSMPLSAIATGDVDQVLPLDSIAAFLLSWVTTAPAA